MPEKLEIIISAEQMSDLFRLMSVSIMIPA